MHPAVRVTVHPAVRTATRVKTSARPQQEGPVGVTIVAGGRGAGKSALVAHLVTASSDARFRTVELGQSAPRRAASVPGALCGKPGQHLVVEAEDVADVHGLVGDLAGEATVSLGARRDCQLDGIVVVVDVSRFPLPFTKDTREGPTLTPGWVPRRRAPTEAPLSLLRLADVIVLNKLDRVGNERALEVEVALKRINAGATTLMSVRGQVPLECVLPPRLSFYGERGGGAAIQHGARFIVG